MRYCNSRRRPVDILLRRLFIEETRKTRQLRKRLKSAESRLAELKGEKEDFEEQAELLITGLDRVAARVKTRLGISG